VTTNVTTGNLLSNVIKTSGSTRTAGYWYTGTTNPTNTTRLNYDGNLHAHMIYSIDSLYISYAGTSGDTRFAGVSHTGALYADETNPASWVFEMETLPTIKESLSQGYNGEIAWWYGKDQFTFDFKKLTIGNKVGSLMARGEMNLLYISQLEDRIIELEKRLIQLEK
jgi:hypothetical protein